MGSINEKCLLNITHQPDKTCKKECKIGKKLTHMHNNSMLGLSMVGLSIKTNDVCWQELLRTFTLTCKQMIKVFKVRQMGIIFVILVMVCFMDLMWSKFVC